MAGGTARKLSFQREIWGYKYGYIIQFHISIMKYSFKILVYVLSGGKINDKEK